MSLDNPEPAAEAVAVANAQPAEPAFTAPSPLPATSTQ